MKGGAKRQRSKGAEGRRVTLAESNAGDCSHAAPQSVLRGTVHVLSRIIVPLREPSIASAHRLSHNTFELSDRPGGHWRRRRLSKLEYRMDPEYRRMVEFLQTLEIDQV